MGPSPDVANCTGAGVTLQAIGKLSVELGGDRPAIAQPQLRAGGNEGLVGRGRGAVDDEAGVASVRKLVLTARSLPQSCAHAARFTTAIG
jgi:hypothetical protein